MMRYACILLFFILTVGCSKQENNENVLKIGTNAQYVPFEYKEKGKLVGFDIDLAQAIGAQLGKEVLMVDMDFDALIMSLQQNKVDMIMAGISITPEREKVITMIPYQGQGAEQLYLVFWGNEAVIPVDVLCQRHAIIAAEAGSFQGHFLKTNFPDLTVKTLGNYTDMLMELKHRKIQAVFMEPHVYKGLLKKEPNLTFLPIDVPQAQQGRGNGIGIAQENYELSESVRQALESLKNRGVIHALEQKWLGE